MFQDLSIVDTIHCRKLESVVQYKGVRLPGRRDTWLDHILSSFIMHDLVSLTWPSGKYINGLGSLISREDEGRKSDSIIQFSEKRWVHVHYKSHERQNPDLVVSKLCWILESPGELEKKILKPRSTPYKLNYIHAVSTVKSIFKRIPR